MAVRMKHLSPLTDFQSRNELAQSNDKEVEVEKEFELLPEDHWQESEHSVFLISNDVGRIL